MASRKRPTYIEIDGLLFPQTFLPQSFQSAVKYTPKEGEVTVATFPKCGTTWMCQIVLLILRKGELLTTTEEYFVSCPFLEVHGGQLAEKMPKNGCIKTHLPLDRISFSKQGKYIFVARHPRDCLVSFYHHTKFFNIYEFSDGTFDDYFEVFIAGENDFGDYFDHLLSWYDHRNEPNVFIITFEDMKADHRGTILKVAEFLGEEHLTSLKENDNKLLDHIIKYTSFAYMKGVINEIFKEAFVDPKTPPGEDDVVGQNIARVIQKASDNGHASIGSFIRSGTVGEGKTVLSKEQEERLKARILEKTSGSDVMKFFWPNDT